MVKKNEAKKEVKEKEIGKVFSFYKKIKVAAIKLSGKLKQGDTIHITGTTTDFTQKVDSMQINMKEVEEAKKGQEVGIKVKKRVRPNDTISLAEE